MSRYFSTAARRLLRFIWLGTEPVETYEGMIKDKVSRNTRLIEADRVEIAGGPHNSWKDGNMRVSGAIYKGDKRLTSLHMYEDGTIEFSKDKFNQAQGE